MEWKKNAIETTVNRKALFISNIIAKNSIFRLPILYYFSLVYVDKNNWEYACSTAQCMWLMPHSPLGGAKLDDIDWEKESDEMFPKAENNGWSLGGTDSARSLW